jgi:hypothetical protein
MKKTIMMIAALFGGCSIQSVYVKEGTEQFIPAIAPDSIIHSLFLIGDAGDPLPDGREKILSVLTTAAANAPEKSTIIFLGDNIYPAGLPDELHRDRREMERRLDAQIAVGELSGATTFFIPGNHDWARQGNDGLNSILRQGRYIAGKSLPHVRMLPSAGLPGPSVYDGIDDMRIIFIDTQWWLHEYDKPLVTGALTEEGTKKIVLDSLTVLLGTKRKTIVVAHHPLESHGEHAGFFGWRDHLFPLLHASPYLWIPLPVIGSLYPLSRMWGITQQDFSGSLYAELRMRLNSILAVHPPLAYVSGHEHTLQILRPKTGYHYIVSGYGMQGHNSAVTTGENTLFASRRAPGFMRMDLLMDGGVHVRVIEAGDAEGGEEIYSIKLR